jgi:hypothetical protein
MKPPEILDKLPIFDGTIVSGITGHRWEIGGNNNGTIVPDAGSESRSDGR